jgi:hypothetical protein
MKAVCGRCRRTIGALVEVIDEDGTRRITPDSKRNGTRQVFTEFGPQIVGPHTHFPELTVRQNTVAAWSWYCRCGAHHRTSHEQVTERYAAAVRRRSAFAVIG